MRKSRGKVTARVRPFIVMSAWAVYRSPPNGSSDFRSKRMTGWRAASRNAGPTARRVATAGDIFRDAA